MFQMLKSVDMADIDMAFARLGSVLFIVLDTEGNNSAVEQQREAAHVDVRGCLRHSMCSRFWTSCADSSTALLERVFDRISLWRPLIWSCSPSGSMSVITSKVTPPNSTTFSRALNVTVPLLTAVSLYWLYGTLMPNFGTRILLHKVPRISCEWLNDEESITYNKMADGLRSWLLLV